MKKSLKQFIDQIKKKKKKYQKVVNELSLNENN